MQFQLGGHHLLHRTSVPYFTENFKYCICEQSYSTQAPAKDSPFLPRRERRGLLARCVENARQADLTACLRKWLQKKLLLSSSTHFTSWTSINLDTPQDQV